MLDYPDKRFPEPGTTAEDEYKEAEMNFGEEMAPVLIAMLDEERQRIAPAVAQLERQERERLISKARSEGHVLTAEQLTVLRYAARKNAERLFRLREHNEWLEECRIEEHKRVLQEAKKKAAEAKRRAEEEAMEEEEEWSWPLDDKTSHS